MVVRDDEPALWALTQDYDGPRRRAAHPLGVLRRRARRGLRPRPHPPARAHAPRAEGGPPAAHARDAREPLADLQPLQRRRPARPGRRSSRSTQTEPFGETTRPRRHGQPALARRRPGRDRAGDRALADAELLIADGHHRYETARVYAQEAGTEEAGWVLMCLVALEDPGLTVFPTHRLVRGRGLERYEALARELKRVLHDRGDPPEDELAPAGRPTGPTRARLPRQPLQAPVPSSRWPTPRACRSTARSARLDAAVLEALLLKGVARAHRRRHLPPQRLRLRPRPPAGDRARRRAASTTSPSSCAPPRSSRSARSPRRARACRRSRPTSSRRSRPACSFNPLG